MLLDEVVTGNTEIEKEIRRREQEATDNTATRDSAATTGDTGTYTGYNTSHGPYKDDRGNELFSPRQKGKLRDNPELHNWFNNLSTADQRSQETHRELNNYGRPSATKGLWDPNGIAYGSEPDGGIYRTGLNYPDAIIGTHVSNPFRTPGKAITSKNFPNWGVPSVLPPPVLPTPGPAVAPSSAIDLSAAVANLPQHQPSAHGGVIGVPIPDENTVPKPVTDKVPVPHSPHSHEVVHGPDQQPIPGPVAPVPGRESRPVDIHPPLPQQQALIAKNEEEKAYQEALQAFADMKIEQQKREEMAAEVAAAHAAWVKTQNELADNRLIALNRKVVIAKAIQEIKRGAFDYDPEGSMDDPDRFTGKQTIDGSGVSQDYGPHLPPLNILPDKGKDPGTKTEIEPSIPDKVGGGEFIVDTPGRESWERGEERKAYLQDLAYEHARDIYDKAGYDNERAHREAYAYTLQITAIHNLANVENLVDAEYQQKLLQVKKDLEDTYRADQKIIAIGKAHALRQIEAIPPSEEVDTFSGIEKAEVKTNVRNAIASAIDAIKNSPDYSGDGTEDFSDVRIEVTALTMADKNAIMKEADDAIAALKRYQESRDQFIQAGMDLVIAAREARILALQIDAIKGMADTELAVEFEVGIARAIAEFKRGSLDYDPEGSMDDPDRFTGKQTIDGSGVSMDTDGGYQAALDALPTDIRAAADKIIAQMEKGGVSQEGIKDHIRKWIEREAWALAGPYEDPPSVTDLRRSPIYIKAFDTLSQNGIPADLAEKIAFQATSQDDVDAFIQQQVEYYNELSKAKENAGVESSELTSNQIEYYTELADKLENNGKTRSQDRIDSGWQISGGDVIANKATEDKNPITAQRAAAQLAALNAAVSTAGLVDAETGALTPLGSRLASGDDSAWAEIAKDVWESVGEISPKHIAIIALVTVGLLTAPKWISVLGPLGKSGAAYRLAQAMGIGAILYGTSGGAAEPGDTGPPGRNYDTGQIQGVDGAQAYWTPDGVGYTLPVPEEDHGYEKEINRLIDVVNSLQNKALYGDPAKREERKQQASNIIKVISRLYNKQEVIPLPGDGTANVDDFSDVPLDFSDIPISELTSGQLNSELKRVNSEIQTPGVSGERVKELTDRLMALKKQQRKNRRSKS
jgi:hypothetical protein